MSRISLCSRAHRPTGIGSSASAVWRRSVIFGSAVGELGFEGMKKTLGFVSRCVFLFIGFFMCDYRVGSGRGSHTL